MYEHLTECYDSVMTMLCTSYVNVLMCEGFVRNMWLKFMPDVIVSNVSHESVITLPYVIKNVTCHFTKVLCQLNLLLIVCDHELLMKVYYYSLINSLRHV